MLVHKTLAQAIDKYDSYIKEQSVHNSPLKTILRDVSVDTVAGLSTVAISKRERTMIRSKDRSFEFSSLLTAYKLLDVITNLEDSKGLILPPTHNKMKGNFSRYKVCSYCLIYGRNLQIGIDQSTITGGLDGDFIQISTQYHHPRNKDEARCHFRKPSRPTSARTIPSSFGNGWRQESIQPPTCGDTHLIHVESWFRSNGKSIHKITQITVTIYSRTYRQFQIFRTH